MPVPIRAEAPRRAAAAALGSEGAVEGTRGSVGSALGESSTRGQGRFGLRHNCTAWECRQSTDSMG